MKLLACKHCKTEDVGPGGVKVPVGSFHGPVLTFKCHRCKKMTELYPIDFAQLREAPPEVIKALFPTTP